MIVEARDIAVFLPGELEHRELFAYVAAIEMGFAKHFFINGIRLRWRVCRFIAVAIRTGKQEEASDQAGEDEFQHNGLWSRCM